MWCRLNITLRCSIRYVLPHKMLQRPSGYQTDQRQTVVRNSFHKSAFIDRSHGEEGKRMYSVLIIKSFFFPVASASNKNAGILMTRKHSCYAWITKFVKVLKHSPHRFLVYLYLYPCGPSYKQPITKSTYHRKRTWQLCPTQFAAPQY